MARLSGGTETAAETLRIAPDMIIMVPVMPWGDEAMSAGRERLRELRGVSRRRERVFLYLLCLLLPRSAELEEEPDELQDFLGDLDLDLDPKEVHAPQCKSKIYFCLSQLTAGA
jgi:hypothetical protein